jgi:hypothetical protein
MIRTKKNDSGEVNRVRNWIESQKSKLQSEIKVKGYRENMGYDLEPKLKALIATLPYQEQVQLEKEFISMCDSL